MTLCWTNYIKMTVLHLWSPSCVEIKKVILRKIKCVLEKSQQIRHALGKRHLKYLLHAHKKKTAGTVEIPAIPQNCVHHCVHPFTVHVG